MFHKVEIQKPNFTIRMLLNQVHSEKADSNLSLKAFSHFTLGCTSVKDDQMEERFATLATYLKGPLTLQAAGVVDLGTDTKPLYAIRLDLGSEEESFRKELSGLFDRIMSHEMNGVRYLWNPEEEGEEQKCPHITIGGTREDRTKAETLVKDKYTFTFNRMDYKQIGPHNPHLTLELEDPEYTSAHSSVFKK